MAYDRDRDRVVLFGGESVPDGVLLDDMWEFNGSGWVRVGTGASLTLVRGSARP
jgi:hypothetical protein